VPVYGLGTPGLAGGAGGGAGVPVDWMIVIGTLILPAPLSPVIIVRDSVLIRAPAGITG
jgi:hypothetical protein